MKKIFSNIVHWLTFAPFQEERSFINFLQPIGNMTIMCVFLVIHRGQSRGWKCIIGNSLLQMHLLYDKNDPLPGDYMVKQRLHGQTEITWSNRDDMVKQRLHGQTEITNGNDTVIIYELLLFLSVGCFWGNKHHLFFAPVSLLSHHHHFSVNLLNCNYGATIGLFIASPPHAI